MSRLSFLKQILLSMQSILLVSLLVLSGLSALFLKNEINEAVESEVESALILTRETAAEWITPKITMVEKLAERLEPYPTQFSQWVAKLGLTLEMGNFYSVYVGTGNGDMIRGKELKPLPPDYDPRKRPWYIQASEAGELVITNPYRDATTNELVVTIASPLGQNPTSIVSADLFLSDIVTKLISTQLRWESEIWMLNKEGVVLAQPQGEYINQHINEIFPTYSDALNTDIVNYKDAQWRVSSITIPETEWTFIVMINRDEKNKTTLVMIARLLFISLIVILISAFIMYKMAQTITRPITRFHNQLVDITQSLNLKKRIKVDASTEVSGLAQQTNVLLEKLAIFVNEIIASSAQLNVSADQLGNIAGLSYSLDYESNSEVGFISMAASVEQVSSAVSQITATMEEFSASSSEIADHSKMVVERANVTLGCSQDGMQTMNSMLMQMQEVQKNNQENLNEIMMLGNKSKEVSKVMDLINTLADQTKLIAFNAALEASSAGESGKRFSVVAAEIRRLADSVTDSTQEIEDHIVKIQDSIRRLVMNSEKGSSSLYEAIDLTQKTSEGLHKVVEAASYTSSAAEQISLSTDQQKTASNQVVIALKDIASASSINFDLVKNMMTVTNELMGVSDKLSNLVKEFSIKR